MPLLGAATAGALAAGAPSRGAAMCARVEESLICFTGTFQIQLGQEWLHKNRNKNDKGRNDRNLQNAQQRKNSALHGTFSLGGSGCFSCRTWPTLVPVHSSKSNLNPNTFSNIQMVKQMFSRNRRSRWGKNLVVEARSNGHSKRYQKTGWRPSFLGWRPLLPPHPNPPG